MNNEPLGLPKGSVRAILAIGMLIICGTALFIAKPDIVSWSKSVLQSIVFLYIGVQIPSGRENKEGDN